MPWKESVLMDERMKFVGRLLQGEKMAELCFAGQNIGVKEVNDEIWLVTFMDYDLGYFDEESKKLEPLEYPFVPEIV